MTYDPDVGKTRGMASYEAGKEDRSKMASRSILKENGEVKNSIEILRQYEKDFRHYCTCAPYLEICVSCAFKEAAELAEWAEKKRKKCQTCEWWAPPLPLSLEKSGYCHIPMPSGQREPEVRVNPNYVCALWKGDN